MATSSVKVVLDLRRSRAAMLGEKFNAGNDPA
jgi:hypothetical protein